MPENGPEVVDVRLLGALRATRGGVDVPLSSVRQRAVLARLALAGAQEVPRDRMIADLWGGEPPKSAVNSIQVVVSSLRATFGATAIRTSPTGYALGSDVTVDVARFEQEIDRGIAAALAGDDIAASAALSRALGRWSGEPLLDVPAPFAAPWRDALQERRLQAVEVEARCLVGIGQAAAATTLIGADAAANPFREGLAAAAVLALGASGRQREALDLFETVRRRLGEEMGVDPGEQLQEARIRVLRGQLPRPGGRTGHRVRTGLRELPPTMVGREADLQQLCALLDLQQTRLVTVIGTGGVGKTRLAQAVVTARSDRAVFVSLAGARRAEDVLPVLRAEFRLGPPVEDPTDDIAEAVRTDGRALLLVLDEFEHVLGAAPAVLRLLAGAPNLQCLVTSRSPLGGAAERRFHLGPLPTDGPRSAAAAMLLERISSRDAARVRPEDDADIAEIARLCDGLPLAIELAAARTGVLTLAEVRARVAASFAEPGDAPDGRHSTVRASVQWSTDSLSPTGRAVLSAAAVFRGGFSKEDLGAVAGVTSIVCEAALTELLDRSLIRTSPDTGRFSMLEPVRETVVAQLTEPRRDRLALAHLRRFAWVYCRHPFADRFPSTAADLRALASDAANLQTAITLAQSAAPQEFGWMVARLSRAWNLLGRHAEWREWRDGLLASPALAAGLRFDVLIDREWPSDAALQEAAALTSHLKDPVRRHYLVAMRFNRAVARRSVEEASALRDELQAAGGVTAVAAASFRAQSDAMIATIRGDHRTAIELIEQARSAASDDGRELAALGLRRTLAELHLMAGDLAAAERTALAVIEGSAPASTRLRAIALSTLGAALLLAGEATAAHRTLSDALVLLQSLEWEPDSDDLLLRWAAARSAVAQEDPSAAFAVGVWEAAKQALGLPRWRVEQTLHDRFVLPAARSGRWTEASVEGASLVERSGPSAAGRTAVTRIVSAAARW